MTDRTDLRKQLKQGKLVLFAGAGLSINLKLPTWADLIRRMGRELAFDEDVFVQYGTLPSLAQYYRSVKGSFGSLARKLDREWHRGRIDIGKSSIHKLIVAAGFPIIYTTNFDHWIERAFAHHGVPHCRIVEGKDISGATEGVTQIVKFHGDLSRPESLVFGEDDYFSRMDFEGELDVKLRSDIARYDVLFVGYSMSDLNIRYLLYRLARMQRQRGAGARRRARIHVFLSGENVVQKRVLAEWGVNVVFAHRADPALALEEFMTTLV